MSTELAKEVLDTITRLPEAQQLHVLEFARSLQAEAPEGEPGTEYLQFAGLFPPEVCDEMERAIEEGCERINPNAW